MRLESCDSLGLSRLTNHIHRLSDTHGHRQGRQVLVERDQHTRLDGRCEEVQHVVRVRQDNCMGGGVVIGVRSTHKHLTVACVQHGEEYSEYPSHSHRRHQHAVRMVGVQGQSSLPEMSEALWGEQDEL